jgi:hypothetical protein
MRPDLAPVEPVTNQLIPLAAVWTAGRAQKDNPGEMGNVILDRTAKILYDGHLFLGSPIDRICRQERPCRSGSSFLEDEASSLSDSAPPAQSHSSLQRTVRELAAPCTPRRNQTQPAAARNKKAAQNGQPHQPQFRRAAIISAETARTVTKETGR